MDDVVPARGDRARDRRANCRSQPAEPNYSGEVAQRWRYLDGSGEIGVIASVTQAFCGDCTRARLSTEGKLHTCLFATHGHDLRDLLRGGSSDAEIRHCHCRRLEPARRPLFGITDAATARARESRDVLHRRVKTS